MKIILKYALAALALASTPAAGQSRPATAAAKPAAAAASAGLTLNAFLDQQGQAFSRIDADGNGVVSPLEFAEHRARSEREQRVREYQSLFAKLDSNRDGILSGVEFMKLAGAPPARDTKPEFSALDTNRDGKISRSEFLLRMTTSFDRLDANKDGTIDQFELARSQQPPAGR